MTDAVGAGSRNQKHYQGLMMRVLFFAADGISAPVRIVPLLEALQRTGQIEGYACVDRDLFLTGAGSPFDALLVHRNPSKRQFDWIRRTNIPFIYDIDDLIVSNKDEPSNRRTRERNAVRWCLGAALQVTSPSRHLLAVLERRLGMPFGSRARYLPSCGGSSRSTIVKNGAKPSILWVSSHGHDYAEFRAVARGISGATRAAGTSAVLVGKFAPAVLDMLANARHIPWIEPRQFESFLAEGAFVAASPMPIALGREEQEFVDCKSDIKAAQYDMRGIDGLYSPVQPYRDSDLPCRLSRGNAAADWEEGLVRAIYDYPTAGSELPQNPLVKARQVDVIAAQLLDSLRAAQNVTGYQFHFRALATPSIFRLAERKLRSLRKKLSGAGATGR